MSTALERLFFEIGQPYPESGFEPVVEGIETHQLYIKFMSDGGKTDDEQGLAFQKYLANLGIPFAASRARSLIMHPRDFERLFGPFPDGTWT